MDPVTSEHHGVAASERATRVAFVLEQHVGHRTYSDNLRAALAGRSDVVATWVPIDYAATESWWERLPSASVRAALRGHLEVRRGLEGRANDVCVFNTQVPAVVGGRTATRLPYILCTDVTPMQYDAMGRGYSHRADGRGPLRWLKHHRNRSVMQGAFAHAPWSQWAADSLVADYGVEPHRIEVIPPGVDTTHWVPGTHSFDEPMRLLFVGGEFQRKGGDVLLEAFASLPPGGAELTIVTRDEVPRQPGVTVHHHLSPNDPELLELYRQNHVFVLPSRWETFGIAAIEAGASGLAIVATSVGGLREVLIDEVTGVQVEAGSAPDLARQLQRLALDPNLRFRLGSAARARALTHFDSTVNANRLIRLACRGAEAGKS